MSKVVLATDSISVLNPTTFEIYAVTGASYLLNSEKPTNQSRSESEGPVVYIPTKNTGVASYDQYFYPYKSSTSNTLMDTTTDNSNSNAIKFPFVLTIGSTAKSVYVATKVSSTFYISAKSSSTYSDITDTTFYFQVSPVKFCQTFTNSGTGSSNPCSDSSTYTSNLVSYFFISQSNYALGDSIDLSTETDGVYYSLKFTNKIHSSLTPTITSSKKGDGRIILNFSANETMSNFSKVKIFSHNASSGTNLPLGDAANAGSILTNESTQAQSGEMTVNALTNNTTYHLSLFFVDKYNMTSVLSQSVTQTPLKIEELLEKNACFLLTSGFGEDHYVIDYFRNFRDSKLRKFYLGQKFIDWYYEFGPKMALKIYSSDFLRAVVRIFAYSLYFIFNYFLPIFFGVIFSGLVFRKIKLKKIKFKIQ